MTRLTNAFSKRLENHCHALSVHFTVDGFGRVHHRVSDVLVEGWKPTQRKRR